LDVYDEALAYVDAQIERFVAELRTGDASSRTCIAITSPYGLDFPNRRDAAPERLLSEPCLRVPLFLTLPGASAAERTGPIALEDVTPTLLDAAGIENTSPLDGLDLLKRLPSKEPVSMMGKPLVLSMRSGPWRFTWRSNHTPFQPYTRNEGQVVELYDVSTTNTRGARNETGAHPDLVTRYRDFLQEYLTKNSPAQ
jgi:arylsulfatase A-like enzyme